jgi:hypothetical protein
MKSFYLLVLDLIFLLKVLGLPTVVLIGQLVLLALELFFPGGQAGCLSMEFCFPLGCPLLEALFVGQELFLQSRQFLPNCLQLLFLLHEVLLGQAVTFGQLPAQFTERLTQHGRRHHAGQPNVQLLRRQPNLKTLLMQMLKLLTELLEGGALLIELLGLLGHGLALFLDLFHSPAILGHQFLPESLALFCHLAAILLKLLVELLGLLDQMGQVGLGVGNGLELVFQKKPALFQPRQGLLDGA